MITHFFLSGMTAKAYRTYLSLSLIKWDKHHPRYSNMFRYTFFLCFPSSIFSSSSGESPVELIPAMHYPRLQRWL